MASIKLHVFRGTDPGTTSCDFRGPLFIGHDQGDEHRTVAEIDPATDEAVELALVNGLTANQAFDLLRLGQPSAFADVAGLLGLDGTGPVGLRIGVWDE